MNSNIFVILLVLMIYLIIKYTIHFISINDRSIIKNKTNLLENIEVLLDEENRRFKVLYKLKNRIVREKYNIDCQSIFLRNDTKVIQQAKLLSENIIKSNNEFELRKDENFIFNKSTCEDYKLARGYNQLDRYNDDIEKKFPIAYAILVYYNVEQIDRLLRLIWRPQNVYCFHIDSKSSDTFKKAIHSITQCFGNVFIAQQSENVIWGHISIINAVFNCMNVLIKSNVRWKYMIHMAGDEFPLKTNYELVKILSVYNGVNDIEIISGFEHRSKYVYEVKGNSNVMTNKTKSDPPHGYRIMKGLTTVTLSRDFVNYILTDQKVKDLVEWSKDSFIPDEM